MSARLTRLNLSPRPLLLSGLMLINLSACEPSVGSQSEYHQTEHQIENKSAAQFGQVSTEVPKTSTRVVSLPGGMPENTSWLNYYKVKTGSAIAMLPVPGQAAPVESRVWSVSPRLSGRIESLRVMLGQTVTQGQKIALIRSSEFAELWRDLKLAEAQQKLRSQELDNAATLAEAHALSQKDLKEAELNLREASLNHTAALEKLKAINVQAEGENAFWLTSPQNGVVVDVNVTAGQEVGPDSTPLVKIAKLDQILVTAQALESDAEGLKAGQTATVGVPGQSGQQVKAKIISVSQAVDPDQHTVPVRLLVTSAPRWLRPNSYVQVSFTRQISRALIVPSEAVVTDDLKSIVFVHNPKTKKLERRLVTLGKQGNDLTEINSGLKVGEVIVSKGAILMLNEVDL